MHKRHPSTTFVSTAITYEQDDWYEMLPLAEYGHNNSMATATQMSPYGARNVMNMKNMELSEGSEDPSDDEEQR